MPQLAQDGNEADRERKRNDAFAGRLACRLTPHHFYRGKEAPHQNFLSLLNMRELGRKGYGPSSEAFQRSLINSGKRYFGPSWHCKFRGKIIYENYWVYEKLGHQITDLNDDVTHRLPPLLYGNLEHHVAEMLFIPPFVVEQPNRPIQYLVLLTDLGRLLFYDVYTREMACSYQLPAHLYKFHMLCWNKDVRELYAVGRLKKPLGHKGRFQAHPAVAMFKIKKTAEIEFKYAFALEPKSFGKVNSVNVSDDILICYRKKPDQLALYDMSKLYSETCMNHEMPGYRDGTVTVAFNLNITKKPEPMIEIAGNYDFVHFCRNFMLLEPSASNQRMKVFNLCDISKQVILNGVNLPMSQNEEKSCNFEADFCVLQGYMDDSARILLFEGIYLTCYDVQRTPPTNDIDMTEAWRTALNLPVEKRPRPATTDGVRRSSSGRTLKPTVAEGAGDDDLHCARIVNLEQQEDLLLVTIVYDKHSYPFFFKPGFRSEEPVRESFASVVFILDSMTGHITGLATVDTIVKNPSMNVKMAPYFNHSITLEEGEIVAVTSDGFQSLAVRYALQEVPPPEETTLQPPPQYESNALNRKQRRHLRRNGNV